jgi:cytidylate kinase
MDAKAEYVLSFIKGFNSKLYWCFESDLLSRVYDTIQKAEKLAVASLVEENITPSRFGCTVYRLNELAEIKENTTYRDESGASTYTYAGNYVFIASGLEQGLYYVNSAEDYMKIKDISTRKFNQQLSILENTTKAYDCSLGIKNQDTFITLTNEQLGTLVQKSEKLEIKNFQDNSPSVLLPHLAKPVLSQADLLNIGKKQEVRFGTEEKEKPIQVFLAGQDVTDSIRSETCGSNASKIASLARVRAALLERQRAFKEPPGLVTDGRDMGSVVFPDAKLKFFLMASAQERAIRRYNQLKQAGINVSLGALLEELIIRDKRDQERSVSPLKPTADAIILDTTGLSIEQVLEQVRTKIREIFILA